MREKAASSKNLPAKQHYIDFGVRTSKNDKEMLILCIVNVLKVLVIFKKERGQSNLLHRGLASSKARGSVQATAKKNGVRHSVKSVPRVHLFCLAMCYEH